MSNRTKNYKRARARGYSAGWAWDFAKTLEAWERETIAGRVRFRFEPEETPIEDCFDFDDTLADRSYRKKVFDLADRAGWWVAIVEYRRRASDPWKHGDSLGGLLGYETPDAPSFEDKEALAPDYRIDMMQQTLESLTNEDRARLELVSALDRIGDALSGADRETLEALDTVREALTEEGDE